MRGVSVLKPVPDGVAWLTAQRSSYGPRMRSSHITQTAPTSVDPRHETIVFRGWLRESHPLSRFAARTKEAVRHAYSSVAKAILLAGSHFQRSLFLGVGLIAFLPLPKLGRRIVERLALFPPGRAADVPFGASKSLTHKIRKFYFELYKPVESKVDSLRKQGFEYDPVKDKLSLRAWYIPAQSGKPTVVFHQQRDANVSYLGTLLDSLSHEKKGYGVFVYDYPGCGKSQGTACEANMYKAGLAASRYLIDKIEVEPSQQVHMGYSLGSIVATKVTRALQESGESPKALVLVNTFPSLQKVLEHQRERWMGFMGRCKTWLLGPNALNRVSTRLNAEADFTKLQGIPTLLLHGDRDSYMPMTLVKAMQERRPDAKALTRLVPLKGVAHHLGDKEYKKVTEAVFDYMKALPESGQRLSGAGKPVTTEGR